MPSRSKGRHWKVYRETCAYCGQSIGANVLPRHAATCWENPEYKRHLQEVIHPGMSASEYEKIFSAQRCPRPARIRLRFGRWQDFIRWLFDSPDVVDVIGEELRRYRDELRRGREGIQVFDHPRRTWTVNGRTFQSWGVR